MLSALRKRNRSECLFGTFVSLIGVFQFIKLKLASFAPPAKESIWLGDGELLIRMISLL